MPATPEIIVLGLRAASFVADLQAAGIVIFLIIFRPYIERSAVSIRSLGAWMAVAGLILTLGNHLLEPARMVGTFSGVFDPSMHKMLLETNVASAAVLRIGGLVMIWLGMRAVPSRGDTAALIGATVVAFSFALTGHTSAHDQQWILIILLLTHLLCVALWFGALPALLIATQQETSENLGRVIVAFTSLATRVVPALFLVGVGMSVLLLEEISNLWTPYGTSLLIKVAGFAILMGLASLNKWRLGPAIASGSATSIVTFRRSVVLELILIIGIIAVTAVMTGLFSPTH